MSDYRVGQMYQLKVPAFIMVNNGLLMTVEEGRARGATEAEVFLDPGTFFTVRQIKVIKDQDEPRTEIYAEISSGPKRGRLVNLRTVSVGDRGPAGSSRLNAAVLEPFMGR